MRELLSAGKRPVRGIWLLAGMDPSRQLDEIEALARRRHVPLEVVTATRFGDRSRTESHQGVLAFTRPLGPVGLDALCRIGHPRAPFLVVASGVTDPRNLGALLRSAECAGVSGVVLPRHRSVHLTPTVAKVAAGAIEHLSFALVAGVPAALRELGDLGVWRVGLAADASRNLDELSFGDRPLALVIGGEERGLAPLARRRCDEVVSIPQHGTLPSLNLAVAAGVACFAVARQRELAAGTH